MSPHKILAALAAPKGLPRDAMAAAGELREEMIPALLDLIQRLQGADASSLSDEDQGWAQAALGPGRDARAGSKHSRRATDHHVA
jgi:hypothetical protein